LRLVEPETQAHANAVTAVCGNDCTWLGLTCGGSDAACDTGFSPWTWTTSGTSLSTTYNAMEMGGDNTIKGGGHGEHCAHWWHSGVWGPQTCSSTYYGALCEAFPSSSSSGATCSDGLQNQGETGVDCGGPCDPCVPSGYTDQGAGCCESGDFAANSIYSGSSNGLDDCAAKCDANQACGYVSYGWAGSTWCGLLKAQTLNNVNSGATACGSSGSNGVHCYAHAARGCRDLAPNHDCWEAPDATCDSFYDTFGGGRLCRLEGGKCDGFGASSSDTYGSKAYRAGSVTNDRWCPGEGTMSFGPGTPRGGSTDPAAVAQLVSVVALALVALALVVAIGCAVRRAAYAKMPEARQTRRLDVVDAEWGEA